MVYGPLDLEMLTQSVPPKMRARVQRRQCPAIPPILLNNYSFLVGSEMFLTSLNPLLYETLYPLHIIDFRT